MTIDGVPLDTAQSMTVRVALQTFAMDLHEHGLGDDENGKAICAGYLRCIGEMNELILRSIGQEA